MHKKAFEKDSLCAKPFRGLKQCIKTHGLKALYLYILGGFWGCLCPRINKCNSTVCGYPGRDFDWDKFDWEGKANYISIFKNVDDMQAPLPWVDDGLIEEGNQYLHVPYDFAEHGTIYRVRPNESMRAGETYRGRLIKQTRTDKKDDGWYWQLEFEGE